MNAKVEMNAGARARLLCAAVASVAVLSACGGGGGSTAMMDSPGETPPTDIASALRQTAGGFRDVVAVAARNKPSYGSVTQSSNGDGGETTDQVEIEAVRDGGVVTYTLTGRLGGDDSFSYEAPGREQSGRAGEYRDELRSTQVIDGTRGTLYVRTITNFEDPAAGAANTNYLSAGYWAFLPEDGISTANLSFGAFADGTNPFRDNMVGLTGTASYEGGAGGVFVSGGGEETRISPFEAAVNLTAEFGDGSSLGSISGRIDAVEGRDGTPLDPSPVVTLQSADIGPDNSGFFTGETSMTFGDDDATYTGSWGGHFLGDGAAPTDRPLGVVGTFGTATGEGVDPTRSLVGAFFARRDEASP